MPAMVSVYEWSRSTSQFTFKSKEGFELLTPVSYIRRGKKTLFEGFRIICQRKLPINVYVHQLYLFYMLICRSQSHF